MRQRVLWKLGLIFAFLVLPMSLQMLLQASPVAAQAVKAAQQDSAMSAQAVNSSQWISSVSKPAAGNQKSCTMGLYVISLHNFDLVSKSFAADMWIWSICDDNICENSELKCDVQWCDKQACYEMYEPLQNMEFANANVTNVNVKETNLYDVKRCETTCNELKPIDSNSPKTTVDGSKQIGETRYWATKRISGIFGYKWDVSTYPFDRQTLEIVVEDANSDIKNFVYGLDDPKNLRCNQDMVLPGWKIKSCELWPLPGQQSLDHNYSTTFGDSMRQPGQGSTYTRMQAEITLRRTEQASFLKLMAPAWIAFIIGIFSFFLTLENQIGARMTLLAAALFTVVVNMRVANDTLGSSAGWTLVDTLYISTLVGILLAVVITIILWCLLDKQNHLPAGQATTRELDFIKKLDNHWFVIILSSFIAVNIASIAIAYFTGLNGLGWISVVIPILFVVLALMMTIIVWWWRGNQENGNAFRERCVRRFVIILFLFIAVNIMLITIFSMTAWDGLEWVSWIIPILLVMLAVLIGMIWGWWPNNGGAPQDAPGS